MEDGELYRARKMTRQYLERKPKDPEAQKLMAEIIDREIVRHKELFDKKVMEELSEDEISGEARTWLERAKALMEVHQYDEALLAAEKVFQFDPDSGEASSLIDEIRQKALKEGKQELLVKRQIMQKEIKDRIGQYHEDAAQAIIEGRWGEAKLTVEKILLLEPEDKDALKMQEQIQKRQKMLQEAERARQPNIGISSAAGRKMTITTADSQ